MSEIKDFKETLGKMAIAELNISIFWDYLNHEVFDKLCDLKPYFEESYDEHAHQSLNHYERFVSLLSIEEDDLDRSKIKLSDYETFEEIEIEIDNLIQSFETFKKIHNQEFEFNLTLLLTQYIPEKYKKNIIKWCDDGIKWANEFKQVVKENFHKIKQS